MAEPNFLFTGLTSFCGVWNHGWPGPRSGPRGLFVHRFDEPSYQILAKEKATPDSGLIPALNGLGPQCDLPYLIRCSGRLCATARDSVSIHESGRNGLRKI